MKIQSARLPLEGTGRICFRMRRSKSKNYTVSFQSFLVFARTDTFVFFERPDKSLRIPKTDHLSNILNAVVTQKLFCGIHAQTLDVLQKIDAVNLFERAREIRNADAELLCHDRDIEASFSI